MSATFLTSLTEAEFKDFLKAAIKEVLKEEVGELKSTEAEAQPIGIKEAASLLKLKITTLYEKTCKKIIPHFKQGNKLYFYKEDLLQWVKKGKVKTKEEIEGQALSFLMNKRSTHR